MMTVEEKVRDHDGNWAEHNEDELGTKMRGRLVRRVVLEKGSGRIIFRGWDSNYVRAWKGKEKGQLMGKWAEKQGGPYQDRGMTASLEPQGGWEGFTPVRAC